MQSPAPKSKDLRNINQKTVEISVVALPFRDIYVGKNATLVCDDKTHVLWARYITLDVGARLVTNASVPRIDCAGIESLPRLRGGERPVNLAAKGVIGGDVAGKK